ncbi:MAG: molybdenum cofactor biosynthesis protein MoaE [Eubacteriaceae bacterium]|nr:molybdenum cofactor biosynthesis protein MoaE [Eubacteriaceae bacterium]
MAQRPSVDEWLEEARREESAGRIGMYLLHNGTVRETPKADVRGSEVTGRTVTGMKFSYDREKVSRFVEKTKQLEGIYLVKLWLNEGLLGVGDDIMLVLIGGDIRPRVIDALNYLVGSIKSECVTEEELY